MELPSMRPMGFCRLRLSFKIPSEESIICKPQGAVCAMRYNQSSKKFRLEPTPELNEVQGALLKSLDEGNVGEWKRLQETDAAGRLMRQRGPQFRDQFFDKVGDYFRLLRESQDPHAAVTERLPEIIAILESSLNTGLRQDTRLSIFIENALCALQKWDPSLGVIFAHKAIEKGMCARQSKTLLFTICRGVEDARGLADLQVVLRMSRTAFEKTPIISETKPHLAFNKILAKVCDPNLITPEKSRLGPKYSEEKSLLDVAERMLVGIQLAEELQIAGVPFSCKDTWRRFDISIRNACDLAVGVALRWAVASERIRPSFASFLARQYCWLEGLPPPPEETALERYETLAVNLFKSTLAAATRCFKPKEDSASVQIVCRHNITGKTISMLVSGLELSKIPCTQEMLKEVATLTHCALAVPEVFAMMTKSSVVSALHLVNVGELNPVERARCVESILHQGLKKIDDMHLLSELSGVLDAAQKDDPNAESEYSCLKARINQRIDWIKKTQVDRGSANPRSDAGQQGGRSANQ